MNYFRTFVIGILIALTVNPNLCVAQSTYKSAEIENGFLEGAWEANYKDGDDDCKMIMIICSGYYSKAIFCNNGDQFLGTMGGKMEVDEDMVEKTYEFNSMDPSMVKKEITISYKIDNSVLRFEGEDLGWKKIDSGTPGALSGAWLMTGRKRDGELKYRKPGARRTMKILSGTRFQWIAFNDETAEFKGSGGGTYTTINGRYTETIEFFSRDKSRVGAALSFDFNVKEDGWHHSGLSSKGNPIYEVWAKPKHAMMAP